MAIIRTDYLNDLLDEYNEFKFNDEDFKTFVERTKDNNKYIVIDLGD